MVPSQYGTATTALAIPADPDVKSAPSFLRARCIICEARYINGGMDIKFEADPFNTTLHGILGADEYSAAMDDLNDRMRQCRSSYVDKSLLIAGPLLFPLIPFALRKKAKSKLRRRIITRFVNDFNRQYTGLLMRWQSRPFKQLAIFSRAEAEVEMNR